MSSDTSKSTAGEGSSASASGERSAPNAGGQAAADSAERGDGPGEGQSGGPGDLKDRFRAALQRKQSRSEVNTGYTKGEPKVHEARESGSRKRQFRRKSG